MEVILVTGEINMTYSAKIQVKYFLYGYLIWISKDLRENRS